MYERKLGMKIEENISKNTDKIVHLKIGLKTDVGKN
jgi:hypothetical protein